jgi:hypothetical protein
VAVIIAIAVALSLAIFVSVAYCRHHCRWPLLLQLPSPITTAVSFALPSAIAVAAALTVGHCHLHHHWQLQSLSPLAITVAIAVAHCQEVLPWRGENCIQTIEANNAYLILFCSDSGRRTYKSWMTDQASSSDGQHQCWVESREQRAASGGSGWQQGGSRVETLPDHGRCCFVGLLGCLPLTDGICDDVLDVVQGIAGETMIELTQEEKRLKKDMGQTRTCIIKKESETCDTLGY